MISHIPHYYIIGGGISGLSTAYLISLLRPTGTYRLSIIENSSRWGGWIRSVKNDTTNAVYEMGPHSARVASLKDHLLIRMALSLNLNDDVQWMTSDKEYARRLLYMKDRIVPVTFYGLINSGALHISYGALFYKLLFSRLQFDKDLSVDEFIRTRLCDDLADYVGSAVMRGIYAGDSRLLSARACVPSLVGLESVGPNLFWGAIRSQLWQSSNNTFLPKELDAKLPKLSRLMPEKTFSWYLAHGMQTFVDALVKRLQSMSSNIKLYLNTHVSNITSKEDKFYLVRENEDGCVTDFADGIFLCCPSYETYELLRQILPLGSLYRLGLDKLPWTDVVVAVLEVASPAEPPFRGFGHLVPRPEDPYILGVVYDSIAMPKLDGVMRTVRFTVMMLPFEHWEPTDSLPQSIQNEIEKIARHVLMKHLNLKDVHVVGRQIVRCKNCIPQYPIGHLENISNMRAELKKALDKVGTKANIHLVGYSYDGVGLPDSVRSALKAVCQEFQIDN